MKRREGIAYLVNGNEGLATFSDYGSTTEACAPVAWRLAYLFARESGESVSEDGLDSAMSLVVNSHPNVKEIIRDYGHGMYR